MKVPLFVFALIISYVLGDVVKLVEKTYPKKVKPYSNGKILINSKYELKARNKPTTVNILPPGKKSYTVFQLVSMSKMMEGVPDSPYFPIDHGFDQKTRVKKILPDYAWSAVRVKRDADNENINKSITESKVKVEQKSKQQPKTTKPGKVESPSMRNLPKKTGAKEEIKQTTNTNTKIETKIEKTVEKQISPANVTKTSKKNESKTSKKDETKKVKKFDEADIKSTTKSKVKRSNAENERTSNKIKPKLKGVSVDTTTGKLKSENGKNKPQGKGVKDASKLKGKKLTNANKLKKNGTTARGAVSKNKKKDKKRKESGKSPSRSKRTKTKSKAKKSVKSKSTNATHTAAKKLKASRRLIAAREAMVEDYPYVVSIQKDGHHWCTGALLNPRLVITTANCLWKANRVSRMEVRAGSRYIDRGGQMAAIQEVMKHPGWGLRKSPDNDVALLLLDRNIRFSDSVHGVDLPNRVMLPPFDDAWVTSWGSERRDGIYDIDSSTLQVYHTRLMNHEKCNNVTMRFSVIVSENFICLAQSGRAGPCTRDTGAPAVSDGILWGLASWGIRKLCGTERFPSMFSYLASHSNLDFIANATRFLMADKRYYPFVDRYPTLN